MGICTSELREYVIRPALQQLGVETSTAAENLLLGTAAQESGLGFHLNNGKGQRYGIYRIDSKTHRAIWDEYLAFNPDLASKVRGLASQHKFLTNPDAELATNLIYATAIAWLVFERSELSLPADDDIAGLANLWCSLYCRESSQNPASDEDQFLENYREFVKTEEELAA